MKISRKNLSLLIEAFLKEENSDNSEKIHVVKSGDNFSNISKKYGVATSQILNANPDIDPKLLQIGQKIKIPSPAEKLNDKLKISNNLVEWMKFEEGKVDKLGYATGEPHLKSYDDGAGNLTIGFGRNQKSQRPQTIDKEYAVKLLNNDLDEASNILKSSTKEEIDEAINIPFALTQNQFDALTSIVFNAGRSGYANSKLHKDFISKGIYSGKDFENAFLNAKTKSGFSGLEDRRKRELKIFKDGIYETKKKRSSTQSLEENKEPAKGTGKKPKGSSRRLYTDENPKDTVSVKFRTAEDIRKTLSKKSFKSKSHNRQSQIINLIHQRVRAAYQNAKDPDVKKRLKRALEYAEERKEASKRKTQRMNQKK